MKILVAPEDNKGLDRVSEHLYLYHHLPMRSQQQWNHKIAWVTVQGPTKEGKSVKTERKENHSRSEEAG